MKSVLNVFALGVILCLWGSLSVQAAEVAVGEPAPEFTAVDTHGNPQNLSAHRGSYVVLEWFNPDCPFVKKHYDSGNMQAIQKEATGKEVVWLTINSSAPGKQGHCSADKANELTKQGKASPTAVILDPEGEIGRLYGAKTTPHMFVVDPEGTLIYAGAIDDKRSADPADIPDATNYVKLALDQSIAGQSVTTSETQSYGCSVKY